MTTMVINPTKRFYEAPVTYVVPVCTEEDILNGSATIDDLGDEDVYGVSPFALGHEPSAVWIL